MTSDQTRQAVLESVKSCLKTVLSPNQAKHPEKFAMNPTKGVCNTLWNISHKVQLVAEVARLSPFYSWFQNFTSQKCCNAF